MPLLSKVLKSPNINIKDYLEIKFEDKECQVDNDPLVKAAAARANEIVEEAQMQAQDILQQAEVKAREKMEEGYNLGFKQGYQEGLSKSEAYMNTKYEHVKQVLSQVKEIHDKACRETEEDLVRLAVAIAEKLVIRQLELSPETVVDMVREASQQFQQADQITVLIHPEDAEILKQRKLHLTDHLGEYTRLYIIGDGNMPKGTFKLESENGFIEIALKDQIEKLGMLILGD